MNSWLTRLLELFFYSALREEMALFNVVKQSKTDISALRSSLRRHHNSSDRFIVLSNLAAKSKSKMKKRSLSLLGS